MLQYLPHLVLCVVAQGTDRLAGLLFGIARGAIIIVILVMLAGLTPLPESPWWVESQLIPHFQALAVWLNTHMPDSIAGYVTKAKASRTSPRKRPIISEMLIKPIIA
jgi:uncharacterized membrane protein required for colicin V production